MTAAEKPQTLKLFRQMVSMAIATGVASQLALASAVDCSALPSTPLVSSSPIDPTLGPFYSSELSEAS